MRVLTVNTDHFDTSCDFMLALKGSAVIRCVIREGYQTEGDGVKWAMQRSAMLKDSYTAEEALLSTRLLAETPVKHGDLVKIGHEVYQVRTIGNFSDAALFSLVNSEVSNDRFHH